MQEAECVYGGVAGYCPRVQFSRQIASTLQFIYTQRRFLKRSGMMLPNEHKQRKAMKGLVDDGSVVTEQVDFIESQGNECKTLFARVRDISTFITELLDQHRQHQTLTWHNNNIPQDEIWVNFGGDHGKDSLKFTMQIANTEKPNSKYNTFMLAMATIKDNYDNFTKCMSILQPELIKLNQLEWEGKRVVLFVFGGL